MVADDDDDFRSALVACLEQVGGLSVVEARDGLEAISVTLATRPDLLLLDYRMPGLNGGEVVARLREGPVVPTIIFITASSEPHELAKAAGVGNPSRADEVRVTR